MLAWVAASAVAGVTVDVDPRVELLHSLMRAAGAKEFSDGVPAFNDAVDARFAGHADDPAIRAVHRLRTEHSIGYDALPDLAIHLNPDRTAAVPLRPFPADLDRRWEHAGLARWLRQVRRFARRVGWDAFFAEQQQVYADQVDVARRALTAEDVGSWFLGSFGREPELHVHLSPTSGNHNFGPSSIRPDGTHDAQPVIGMSHGGAWTEATWTQPNTLPVLVHEVAHGFANPVALADPSLTRAAEAAFALRADALRAQAYGGGDTVAAETVTRALTTLYLRDRHPDLVWYDLARDEQQGFEWAEAAADALAGCRTAPAGPIDLGCGAPAVAAAVDAWAALPEDQRTPVFRGSVNAAVDRVRAVIAPIDGPLGDYARKMFATFYAQRGAVLVPTDATERPAGGLVAYGSPESNRWVATIAEEARWTLETGGVAIDGRWFPGEHLALIAVRPYPDDPRAPALVYAAASDDDLVGINGVFHGPTDWQVVRHTAAGFEIVAKGDFLRDAGWTLPGPPLAALVDPASVGLDPTALDALLRRATESKSDAIAIWVDGTQVVRWPEVQAPIETMSATKSVVDLAIGMLVADGKIPSIDAPAARWVPALKGDRAKITLRMLLEHTSGLEVVQSNAIYAAPDIVAFAAARPLTTRPGAEWAYNNSAANLVAAIGTAAAGQPLDRYVQDRLLAPLGIGPREWGHDPAGNVHGGAGLALTADDLQRIGQLMLDHGQWHGQQLVPADWVRDSVAPSPKADWFGWQWWVSFRDHAVVGFRADGWLGQQLVVVPEKRLVAVRQMRATPEIWKNGDLGLDTMKDFEDRVLDLVYSPGP